MTATVSAIGLLIGFALLAKGADWLVRGAGALAARFGISDRIIGLTIVALGTSAPELFVSTLSAITGRGGIAVGNIMGSNIANITLVLGAVSLLGPIAISKGSTWRELPYCVLSAAVTALVCFTVNTPFLVSRAEAALLLLTLGGYLWIALRVADDVQLPIPSVPQRLSAAWGILIVGLIALLVGADLIVRSSVHIAALLGVPESIIGVTIVAIGTSLPEMATSVTAALRGKYELAVGNVVGSNILNSGLVLGLAGMITPIRSDYAFRMDAGVGLLGTVLLFIFMFTGKRHSLDRWEGALFLIMYAGYIAYTVIGH